MIVFLDSGVLGLLTNPNIVIATTNVKHLGEFSEALDWQDINL